MQGGYHGCHVSSMLDLDPLAMFVRGSFSELRNYRVIGLVGKNQFVINKFTEETFVMKVMEALL